MPKGIMVGGKPVVVCDWGEAAALLGCHWEEVVKFLTHDLIQAARFGLYRYPVHADVLVVAQMAKQQTTVTLEQLLWERKYGGGESHVQEKQKSGLAR